MEERKMANIKPIDQSSQKWTNRASGASPEYTRGVQSPRTPWGQAAAAGNNNWKAGVTQAAGADRFLKGVQKAGDAKWANGATKKGPGRYVEGVSGAGQDWASGFGPFQAAISGVTLPARAVRGSPTNLQRVSTIATLLHNTKLGISGK
jgi:hypothetical protein